MKKLIALLLALLMAFSAVITVSAEGTGAETPEAPKNILAQTRANKGENEKIESYDVRFLATVHSTVGKEIGFEVVATFLNKNGDTLETKEVTYSKKVNEKEDANMAGTTVYTTVTAAGEEYTVADLTENDTTAVGVFAAVIAGVPANLDVVFKINTYVDYEGGTNKSSVVTAQYANGEILNMTGSFGYSQDFNSEMSSTTFATLADAGITKPYGGSMNLTTDNQQLNIPKYGWNSATCFFGLVPRSPFEIAWVENENENKVYNYMLEMDIDISQLQTFGVFLNGSQAVDKDTKGNYRANTLFVSLRVPTAIPEGGEWNGKFQSGTVSTLAATGENLLVRTAQCNGSALSNLKDSRNAYDIANNATKVEDLHLTVVVNNNYTRTVTNEDESTTTYGCQVSVFIGESFIHSFEVEGDTYDVTKNSYISVWAENTEVAVDNIKINKINGVITVDEIPTTNVTEMYSQNFNADPMGKSNVTKPFVNSGCCGLPMSINADKQLEIDYHAWHNTPDYYAHLVSSAEVQSADIYKFEADVAISTAKVFTFTFNNDEYATATTNLAKYMSQMLAVKIEVSGEKVTKLCVDEYKADGSGRTGTKATEYELETSVSATDFKFSAIVDNTDAKACTLYLYINGKLVATHVAENVYDEESGELLLDYHVKGVSAIGIWAENTEATIDNIKFTGVKKNS